MACTYPRRGGGTVTLRLGVLRGPWIDCTACGRLRVTVSTPQTEARTHADMCRLMRASRRWRLPASRTPGARQGEPDSPARYVRSTAMGMFKRATVAASNAVHPPYNTNDEKEFRHEAKQYERTAAKAEREGDTSRANDYRGRAEWAHGKADAAKKR